MDIVNAIIDFVSILLKKACAGIMYILDFLNPFEDDDDEFHYDFKDDEELDEDEANAEAEKYEGE